MRRKGRMKIVCSKHKTYKVIRKPQVRCAECWHAWYLKIGKAFDEARGKVHEFETER